MAEVGDVAVAVAVDHPVVVEGEQEGMTALHIPGVVGIHVGVAAQQTLVLDDPLALLDRLDGEHAVAVDGGTAGGDLLRHGVRGTGGERIVAQPPQVAPCVSGPGVVLRF